MAVVVSDPDKQDADLTLSLPCGASEVLRLSITNCHIRIHDSFILHICCFEQQIVIAVGMILIYKSCEEKD